MARPLRAIDLYSGVGGWSLGLRLAGIQVVSSYELWGPANETNFKNNQHHAQTVDIRRLSLGDLPDDIDVVVGSPPCTQFSFSNRGGSGNLEDGLEDIICFLRIVDHLRPTVWAMENVPRVAPIILRELEPGGRLHSFAHLGVRPHIVNMEEYGLPQRRRRCIAGSFDHRLLESYTARAPRRTLGQIISALAADPVIDPIFGMSVPRVELVDHSPEEPLNAEEVRINRAAKATHTVYNGMAFPDRLDRSVRTITATCTRVSRESIVIEAPEQEGAYRRLTVRERASLQGFPATFQFYGTSYGQKLKMIGNAVPPAFSWFMGHVFQGVQADELPRLPARAAAEVSPQPAPESTTPDRPGGRYRENRRFRFAITSLQLKSGVRFELANHFDGEQVAWRVSFWFGNSKSIQTVELDAQLARDLQSALPASVHERVNRHLDQVRRFIREADVANMQTLWAHRGPGRTRPFMLLDALTAAGEALKDALTPEIESAKPLVEWAILGRQVREGPEPPGVGKIARNAPLILAGLLVGSVANAELQAVSARSTSTDYSRRAAGSDIR